MHKANLLVLFWGSSREVMFWVFSQVKFPLHFSLVRDNSGIYPFLDLLFFKTQVMPSSRSISWKSKLRLLRNFSWIPNRISRILDSDETEILETFSHQHFARKRKWNRKSHIFVEVQTTISDNQLEKSYRISFQKMNSSKSFVLNSSTFSFFPTPTETTKEKKVSLRFMNV
jgi:hypothetical protein